MIDLKELNADQERAVRETDGHILVLAGAGSGKTKTLTYRIAYLLDKGIAPSSILALTFTNKAANEIKERVNKFTEEPANGMWMGTIHSICLRILKRHSHFLGYNSFTIYDDNDKDKLIISVIEENKEKYSTSEIDKHVLISFIANKKAKMISPDDAISQISEEFKIYAELYKIYQERLKFNNAMDFDDLLLNTYFLFMMKKDILESYQKQFRYVSLDEAQDCSTLDFKLITMLSEYHNNLFMCCDIDQSIYGFRNADISNLIRFMELYPDGKIVKIETNYRSTSTIVNASNAVIEHNKKRLDKISRAKQGQGKKINIFSVNNEYEEAALCSSIVYKAVQNGEDLNDIAVLYRTNYQSRIVEQDLIKSGIPYQILGGLSFFNRKEIKDILAYIKLIVNNFDSSSFARIANVPKRGIGDASISKIIKASYENKISIIEQLKKLDGIKGINKKTREAALELCNLIESFVNDYINEDGVFKIASIINDIYLKSGYSTMLSEDTKLESESRRDNIDSLITMGIESEEEESDIYTFLDKISLLSDQDDLSSSKVNLMSIHSSKGLEFSVVVIVGGCTGLLPHFLSVKPDEVEEERRLFYVAMTRAKKELSIIHPKTRLVKGFSVKSDISPFILEIPEQYRTMYGDYKIPVEMWG